MTEKDSELLPAVYENRFVKKSNTVIRSKLTVKSVHGNRILVLLAAQIHVNDEELKKYSIPLTSVFQKSRLSGRDYKALDEATNELMSAMYLVKEKNNPAKATKTNVIGQIKWDKGMLYADFHPSMKQHLIKLTKDFTIYNVNDYVVLNGVYAQKLFELFSSAKFKGEEVFELAYLFDYLDIGKDSSLRRYPDFKRYVIDRARENIINDTPFYFEYIPIKKGRSVHALRIIFGKDPDKKPVSKDNQRNNKIAARIVKCMEKNGFDENGKVICLKPTCPKYVQKTCSTLTGASDQKELFKPEDVQSIEVKL